MMLRDYQASDDMSCFPRRTFGLCLGDLRKLVDIKKLLFSTNKLPKNKQFLGKNKKGKANT